MYRDKLEEAEIDHQLVYLADPVSQQIVAKQGSIMDQSMQVGQEWGQDVAECIMTGLRERSKEKE